jgi:phosphoenolpyruvate carboxylase
VASFFRMGHWIGGDRDGNPNVTAATLRTALARQSETALRFYLTEVHLLGGELSVSHARTGDAAMHALAERSPDRNRTARTSPTAAR